MTEQKPTSRTHDLRLSWLRTDIPTDLEGLAYVRKGVSGMMGIDDDLFHNHVADAPRTRDQALVQYRAEHGKATFVGIGTAGETALQKLLTQVGKPIRVGNREHRLSITSFDVEHHALEVSDYWFDYTVQHWLPFDDKNFDEFERTYGLKERVELLNKLLNTHLVVFRKNLGWYAPPYSVKAEIGDILKTEKFLHKGIKKRAYSVSIRSNLELPTGIAIGRSISHGFGVVERTIF